MSPRGRAVNGTPGGSNYVCMGSLGPHAAMGSHCQIAKSRKSDIQQNIIMESHGIRIPDRFSNPNPMESWNPKSVCWLICCSAAGISRHLKQHIAGSSSSQLYSSRSPAVVLYKIFSNPFSFIRRSSFMKLNIEIKHLQTWISRPTQHDFRN